jgi:hypothetical protein
MHLLPDTGVAEGRPGTSALGGTNGPSSDVQDKAGTLTQKAGLRASSKSG